MKLTKLLILFLFLSLKGFSQKPFLSKSVIETFVPISGGTILPNTSNCDDCSDELNLPFSFTYNGNTTYNKLYIYSNGYISLNKDYNDYDISWGENNSVDLIRSMVG